MRWLIIISLLSSIVLGGSWEKEFTFSVNDMIIEQVDGYDYIKMPDFMNPTEGGTPMIPFYSVSILIPPTAEITEVTITNYKIDTLSERFYLYPTQPPRPIGETIPFVPPNDSIYALDTEYPAERARGIRSGCKSGYRIAGIFLFPISYIPKDSLLLLDTTMTVHIEYEEDKYEASYLTNSQKDLFSQDVEKLVINSDKIEEYSPPIHQVDNPEIDYVIVTREDLKDDFLPLVNWFRKTGIWAETKSTDSIYLEFPIQGRRIDQQWQIRDFITHYYNNHGLKYVLLAGDVPTIPARLGRVHISNDSFFRNGAIPCDLYYSDLQYSWDGNQNGFYGDTVNVEGVYDTLDLYSDVYLGRFSVETPDTVSIFIDKLFRYEKYPKTLNQKRILLPACTLYNNYNHMISQYMIDSLCPEGWTDRVINLHDDYRLHPNLVKDSINSDSGFAFCHLVSHGTLYEIGGLYWYNQPREQHNDSSLTIFNAISCDVGNFNYPNNNCLAEEMLKVSNCAVAVMMNSSLGVTDLSGFFDAKFYDFFFHDSQGIATTHQRSKEFYRNEAMDSTRLHYRWVEFALNLQGEPSMPLWTDNPRTMVADFPEFIYSEQQNFSVSVTSDNNPVNNALVCLWKGNEVYDRSTTNASGVATFVINPTSSGYMYVTVTARNKLPVEDSCEVTPLLTDRRLNVELRHFQSGGVTINRVTTMESSNFSWAVGDSGQVFKLYQTGWVDSGFPITLNAEYNLTGVSFAPNGEVGYIVGYKRDSTVNGPKWKGGIWKTTNGGNNWIPIDTLSLPRFSIPTPFLDVHAVNANVVWISCGNGYVLITTNAGQDWRRTSRKPSGENHFGWLWGIDAPDENTAWVCSDQSGLIAMTTNGGDTWISYKPYETDSLTYFDIDYYNDEAVVATSKGRLLADSNSSWNKYFPFGSGQTAQWFYGAFNLDQKWGVGSGGMIGSYSDSARKYWCSKKYDLRDIEGFNFSSSPWENRYFMVGTNATILWGKETELSGDSGMANQDSIPEVDTMWLFDVEDISNDHGWKVRGGWQEYPDADSYRFYCKPKTESNLYGTTGNGSYYWIESQLRGSSYFYYDSSLTGQKIEYAAVAYLHNGESRAAFDTCTATDDVTPPKVTGLKGTYNDTLDAVQIWWNPVPQTGDTLFPGTFEPNLAGYWVCPETLGGTDFNINHPCPLNRNYYMEKVPNWVRGHYWGFWVCAMDRSGNRGNWSDSVLVWIPPMISSSSYYATAFNQGRHLARDPETFELHMVFETNEEIRHSYSDDNGENWTTEEISDGCLPSIGLDHKGYPWIAYWHEGDIICKVKRPAGTWHEFTVYDGNDTIWAGAPAIAMGTLPEDSTPPDTIPLEFAYVIYGVYEGDTVPDMPSSPPYPCTNSSIKLSILDTLNMYHYTIDEGDSSEQVSNPSIAVTPADYIHLVWQKDNEIMYNTNNEPPITYENWHDVEFVGEVNLSQSPNDSSQHPFAEAWGDKVYAAWKEDSPGEILRRMRYITSNEWEESENISQSAEVESDYPVLSSSDVVAYQEKVDTSNYEIYAWIQGDIINFSETDKPSTYPHIVVEPQEFYGESLYTEIVIDGLWTEEIKAYSLYEVKFRRYIHPLDSGLRGEFMSVATGDSVASPYCEQRDGFVQFGQYSLDYANSSLIYNLPYLNPKSSYLLRATVYHALTKRWREMMYTDSILGADVYFDPNVPTAVNIVLPKESYANDFEIRKEIQKMVGRYAVITDFKIYEVSILDTGGGVQNAGLGTILKTALYQNHPNPFKSNTVIHFSLAKESKVSCLVFDATGRRIRTIVNDKLKPGHYNLRWDGKDNHNRKLAQGIYFYRLQTEDFKDTKKTVLLK